MQPFAPRSGWRRLLAAAVALSLATGGWASPPAGAAPPEERLPWIVTLGPAADPAAEAPRIAAQYGGGVGHVYRNALRGFSFRGSAQAAERLSRDPRVRTVVADQPVFAATQVLPTGIQRIGAGESGAGTGAANEAGASGFDADIAIIDTGVDVDHPDLSVAGGTNCTSEPDYDDRNGHGTHVAGTAAARDDSIGVIGAAPGARIWAVKVLNATGSGTWSSVICGIDWVTANAATIDVANLSLGGSGSKGTCADGGLNEAICRSANAGVVYTVAAGNSAADAARFVPASYDEVITVSALADFDGWPGGTGTPTCQSDDDDSFADFSNYGSAVDIIAPGVCIRSTYKDGGYATLSGTSMAAPHVAGVAALYRAANPTADWSQVKSGLATLGNLDWNAADDPDGIKETLLNVAPLALAAPPSAFVPLPAPRRLFDTRTSGGYVQPGQTISQAVLGQAGVPPSDVTAVVLNVTGVAPGGAGFVTVWPTGSPRPHASSLNFTGPDQVRPNLVIVPVGADGSVSFYSQSGGHLLADVAGYFRPAATSTSGRLTPLAPQRVLDTREGIGAAPAKPGAGSVVTLQATGRGGVPASGVGSVVLNVTAADATAAGYVTVWPAGQPQPFASNLNQEAPGHTSANLVIVPVDANGQVSLFTLSGTHLVADVLGWFGDESQPASTSGLFVTLNPGRVFDTRPDAFVSAGSTISRTHAGVTGIPRSGVIAVSVNLTATAAAAVGYVTSWPEGGARPNTSTLILHGPGDTRPNAAILPLGAGGAVSFYSHSGAHLLADTNGYFIA